MRKSSLRTAVLMLSSAWVLAQSGAALSNQYPSSAPPSAQQPTQQPDKSQTANGGDTIEGCLSRNADNFTLTDASGTTYYLAGDSGKLATHVGQQVRISGGDIAVAPGAAPSGATSGAAGGGHKFVVKKVKTLASSCSTK